jgi:DNA polymerase-3 subunit epsilon
VRTNQLEAACDTCFTHLMAGSGRLMGHPGHWRTLCLTCEPQPPSRGRHRGWFERPLASLDFETTGVDPHTDRVLSYALLDVGDERAGLIDAGVPIPAASTAVHGISAESLVGAPPSRIAIAMITDWVQSLIDSGTGLVVFNAAYDLTMLRAEAERHGVRQPAWDRLMVVDPYIIDWGLERGGLGPRRLTDVSAYYGVVLDNAHDATADAQAARDVVIEMGARHREAGGCSLVELMLRQHLWHSERAADWNAYAVTVGRDLDDPTGWPLVSTPRVTTSATA